MSEPSTCGVHGHRSSCSVHNAKTTIAKFIVASLFALVLSPTLAGKSPWGRVGRAVAKCETHDAWLVLSELLSNFCFRAPRLPVDASTDGDQLKPQLLWQCKSNPVACRCNEKEYRKRESKIHKEAAATFPCLRMCLTTHSARQLFPMILQWSIIIVIIIIIMSVDFFIWLHACKLWWQHYDCFNHARWEYSHESARWNPRETTGQAANNGIFPWTWS